MTKKCQGPRALPSVITKKAMSPYQLLGCLEAETALKPTVLLKNKWKTGTGYSPISWIQCSFDSREAKNTSKRLHLKSIMTQYLKEVAFILFRSSPCWSPLYQSTQVIGHQLHEIAMNLGGLAWVKAKAYLIVGEHTQCCKGGNLFMSSRLTKPTILHGELLHLTNDAHKPHVHKVSWNRSKCVTN